MNIKTTKFIKGIAKEEDVLTDGIPQLLFIGRSNVGKSSVINSFTGKKGLAISSATPGRTTQVNVFLINGEYYLVDLPGYGYARGSEQDRKNIATLISWYVFHEHPEMRRVILIIDAEVGLKESDLHMIQLLEEDTADFIILANKIDKMNHQGQLQSLKTIQSMVGNHRVIPYSAKKNIGVSELTGAALAGLSKIPVEEKVEAFQLNRYEDPIENPHR